MAQYKLINQTKNDWTIGVPETVEETERIKRRIQTDEGVEVVVEDITKEVTKTGRSIHVPPTLNTREPGESEVIDQETFDKIKDNKALKSMIENGKFLRWQKV